MVELIKQLDEEIDWRISEMALIKTNHKASHISKKRREILLKYSSVEVYALFEGFVAKAMAIYIDEINKLHIHRDGIQVRILSEYFQQELNLFDERKNGDKREKLIKELEAYFSKDIIELSREIYRGGNINLKKLNAILENYKIPTIDNRIIEGGLHKLLKYRNSIAHGEIGLKVNDAVLTEQIMCVTLAMDSIRDNMIYSFERKLFLRDAEEIN